MAAMEFEYHDGADLSSQRTVELAQPLTRPSHGPSPFEVSLKTFPMQPWTSRSSNLSQWFNYGLNPTTWTQYCLRQTKLLETSEAKFGPTAVVIAAGTQQRRK